MVEFGRFKTAVYEDWLASSGLEGNNNFSCFFFLTPKTALSEAPEAGMIFSQYTVFVKTFYQTTYSGKRAQRSFFRSSLSSVCYLQTSVLSQRFKETSVHATVNY